MSTAIALYSCRGLSSSPKPKLKTELIHVRIREDQLLRIREEYTKFHEGVGITFSEFIRQKLLK